MGQKVSPIGLRVGVIRDWDARWYANDKDFATLLHEDLKIRDYINNKFVIVNIDTRTRQNICDKGILFPLNGALNKIAQYISMKYNFEMKINFLEVVLYDYDT